MPEKPNNVNDNVTNIATRLGQSDALTKARQTKSHTLVRTVIATPSDASDDDKDKAMVAAAVIQERVARPK